MAPQRFLVTPAVRARLGTYVDRLAPFLLRSDDLADAVVESIDGLPRGEGWRLINRALAEGIDAVPEAPEPFHALFAQLDRVPVWVDDEAVEQGGALLVRTGILSGLVLGMQSLVLGYCAPAGNKPLVFSGRLREQASTRLNETARFVYEVCKPGGLRRFSEGFQITVKVRLMHAQVRHMLLRSGRWDSARWGHPINQHDMAATILLFSSLLLDGLRKMGVAVSSEESERYMGLWRYAGHLIGVEPEILPASEREATRLGEAIRATQGEPDDDSRALVKALMEVPLTVARTAAERARSERQIAFSYGVCRALIGHELADKLGVPRDGWRFTVPALRQFLTRAESVRRALPGGDKLAYAAGKRYWDLVVSQGMSHASAEFGLPQRLSGVPHGAHA